MDLVLVHGMGRTPLSMLRLRRRLRRAGHHPVLFGYSPTFETLQGATSRLVRLIGHRVDTTRYALVGHSLGTVIIRSALGQLENRAPSACIFLAPPMLACKAARFFSRFWPYQWLTRRNKWQTNGVGHDKTDTFTLPPPADESPPDSRPAPHA